MNYAWANPITGIREQTALSFQPFDQAERARLSGDRANALAEAKLRVWEEVQSVKDLSTVADRPVEDPFWECTIYRQEPIGTVAVNGSYVDPDRVVELNKLDPGYCFAWADPSSGLRILDDHYPNHLQDVLKALQENRDSKDTVIVYATWPECTVSRSDPRPEPVAPPPEELNSGHRVNGRAGDSPDIDWRRQELENIVTLDDPAKVALHSAWALLDIASTLRELAAEYFRPRWSG